MARWDPWRGCRRCGEGCLHCYIHKGDAKRGVDTNLIVQTKDFDKPVAQLKKGGYKMKPGLVYVGFSTDFLIKDADAWRGECWQMMKARPGSAAANTHLWTPFPFRRPHFTKSMDTGRFLPSRTIRTPKNGIIIRKRCNGGKQEWSAKPVLPP